LPEVTGIRIRKIQPAGGFFWQLGRRLMGVLAFTQTGWRWLLFPILAPRSSNSSCRSVATDLDTLDHDRADTLGFIVEGWKQ
jgi:hypothetical protein